MFKMWKLTFDNWSISEIFEKLFLDHTLAIRINTNKQSEKDMVITALK